MSQTREFRVLSGLHAGASCDISHGAVIGADSTCDIVLADEGIDARAAQVCVGETGWHLSTTTEACFMQSAASAFNEPLSLGPIWVTVALADESWIPAPAEADAGNNSATPSMTSGPAEQGTAADATMREEHPSQDALPGSSAQSDAPRARHTRRRWPIVLGLLSVVLSVLFAIMLTLVPGAAGTHPAREDTGRMAVEQSVQRIAAIIDRLELGARVRVSLSDHGLPMVSGWVRDKAEQDELATALAQVWPMPAMRITNQADAVNITQSALSAFPVRYAVNAQGNGYLDIRGIAATPEDRSAALEAVRTEVPGMLIGEVDIRLAPDVSEAFATLLREAAIPLVTIDWQHGRLKIVPGKLGTPQRRQLIALAEAFNATHLDVVEIVLPAASPMEDSVPFAIRSVVGGTQPYLVLMDGTKLLPGGRYHDYVLLSIEAHRIVFDGDQPATVAR